MNKITESIRVSLAIFVAGCSTRAMILRLAFTSALALAATATAVHGQRQQTPTPAAARPNIIMILVDDMGQSDMSVTGHPTIKTPNLDRMAQEGLRLTSFYSAPVCTPARGMFLTSRYPPRTGLLSPTGPGNPSGIRAEEITLPEALKALGYRTAMFGKWHLGDFQSEPKFNPTAHGFDTFLGIPYSHDYNPEKGVPLFRDTTLVEQPVVHSTMTRRFTEETIRYMRASAGRPFFIYLAHPMPHIPIATSEEFHGHSLAGRYGDVVEELDWSVGQVLSALKSLNLDKNTILVFTSDNGPWIDRDEANWERGERGNKVQGDVGWSGLLRGSKGSTWEGGIRTPAIIRWPGVIPAGRVSSDMVSIMDLFPTFVHAAGGRMPADRAIDGLDQLSFVKSATASARKEFFYFYAATLQAVRDGAWKLRVAPPEGAGAGSNELVAALYNLEIDPAERHNVAVAHLEIADRLRARLESFRQELGKDSPRK